MRVASIMLAVSALFASVSAHATGGHKPPVHDCKPDCETVLTFSKLSGKYSTIHYDNTEAGGDLDITATGGKLVAALGNLGVYDKTVKHDEITIDKNQAITFTFEKVVGLAGWDMSDLWGGIDKFSLSVDGGVATKFSLNSHGPSSALIGKSFTFGYAGDDYMIDTLKFVCEVPEPETYALMIAGLLTAGVMRRRQQRG